MKPKISIVIPTRERAQYLHFSARTCLASTYPELEIVIADNASRDDTAAVVDALNDPRVRYVRSERRLSMRDNFERGIDAASGDYVGIIGDDDGVFPYTPARVVELFETLEVDAVAAARAHYSWPDLLASRAGCGLLPRGTGAPRLNDGRAALRHLLRDNDYYKLPCIYHGFVTKAAIERYSSRHGRFLLSGIADAASTFALCLDNIRFAWTPEPLVINGGSVRSNGASHLGGGSQLEKQNWKVEDDLGFLPGFDGCLTIGAFLVETAIRYQRAEGIEDLGAILDLGDVREALLREVEAREAAGRHPADTGSMFQEAGIPPPGAGERATRQSPASRIWQRAKAFTETRPINFARYGITNIQDAADKMVALKGSNGMFDSPIEQVRTALQMTRS